MKAVYKSIKVPAWVYESARLALDDLARGGTGRIPDALCTAEIEAALHVGPSLGVVLALAVEALRQRIAAADEAQRFKRSRL